MELTLKYVTVAGHTAVCKDCFLKHWLHEKLTYGMISSHVVCSFPGCSNEAYRWLDVTHFTDARDRADVTICLDPTNPREMSVWI